MTALCRTRNPGRWLKCRWIEALAPGEAMPEKKTVPIENTAQAYLELLKDANTILNEATFQVVGF